MPQGNCGDLRLVRYSNVELFDTDHWLSDEKNCMVLRLTQPAYVAQQPSDDLGEPVQDRRDDVMRSWSVAELATFLVKHDLAGPAQQLRAQGVAGPAVLQTDLRFSAFAAHKLLRIRDAYLSGQ